MNKIFVVTYEKYNNDIKTKTVLARNVEHAIINANRWFKKNEYSSIKVVEIKLVMEIDIVYKS